MKKTNLLFLLLFFVAIQVSFSQTLDPTFNSKILGAGFIHDILVQDDGKILAAGDFTYANDSRSPSVARFNSDGTTDLTFSTGTGANGYIIGIGLQSDGKILVGGDFSIFNGEPHNNLVRLNSDGTIDPTFDIGTGPNYYGAISCVSEDSQGFILVGGSFDSFNGIAAVGLIRLNDDGSIEPTFTLSNSPNGKIQDFDFQSDGKIIVINGGSTFQESNEDLLRLNTDGSLDSTFLFDIGFSDRWDLSVLPDDRIAFPARVSNDKGVYITSVDGETSDFYTVGDVPEQFREIATDEDGNIYFGLANIYHFNVNTLEMNTIQPTNPIIGRMYSHEINSDGTLLSGGTFFTDGDTPQYSLIKFNDQLEFENSFNAKITSPGEVNTILEAEDGKLYVGGYFFLVNGQKAINLVRLNSDGSIDPSFQPDILTHIDLVYEIALSSTDKILVGGSKDYSPSILSFNSDGSLSTDFNFDSGAGNGRVDKIIVHPDGFMLVNVSGFFGSGIYVPGLGVERAARLFADGTIDVTLYNNIELNYLYDLSFDNSGNIVLAGNSLYAGADGPFEFMRLNSAWSLDQTFQPISSVKSTTNAGIIGFGSIASFEEMNGGNLLLAGRFHILDNDTINSGIAKLNSDGLLDISFSENAGSGFLNAGIDAYMSQVNRLTSNQYIVSGNSTEYNGTTAIGLASIDSLGFLSDCDFGILSGAVNDVSIVDSTSFFAVGEFILSSSEDHISIAKYINVCETVGINNIEENNSWIEVAPNPTFEQVIVSMDLKNMKGEISFSIFDAMGKMVHQETELIQNENIKKTISLFNFPAGTYFLNIKTNNQIAFQKIIKL